MAEDLKLYLKQIGFDKQYQKIIKKLKNKTVLIYGAGQLFQTINSKYDLSKLNIIGISDGKYGPDDENKDFLGYKKYPTYLLPELKIDYVLVATLNYLEIIESLEQNFFNKTKTHIRPLAKKSLFEILKTIWSQN